MDNLITRKYADHSTIEAFSFSFFCDRCGREWPSARYAFNAGDPAAPVQSTLYEMLWNDQHKAAFARAERDASFIFNRCPVCGRSVCNECFHLSETGASDICKDCLIKTMRRK